MPIRYTCPVSSPKIVRLSRSFGVTVIEHWRAVAIDGERERGRPSNLAPSAPAPSHVVIGLPVDGDDAVAGLQAGLLGRHAGGDVADRGSVGRDLDADREEQDRIDQEREDEVHRRAGEHDGGARGERSAWRTRARARRQRLLLVLLAEHLDVAAERHGRERVLGLAALAREHDRPEADREAQHLHPDALGDREVSELVHEDEDAERDEERERW